MPHLDRQLAAWKHAMRRAGSLTGDDLIELETHLRDTVQQLTTIGLTQEEALLVALRRIGDPSVLVVEFEKVNPGFPWAKRWYWMTVGFLGFSVGLQAIEALSYVTAWLALPRSAAAAGLLLMGVGGYAALSVGMLRSAAVPTGRIARTLQRAASWIERHPVATGVTGFAALIALRFVNGRALAALWFGTEAVRPWMSTLMFLAVTGVPVLLFLVGTFINPPAEPERH